MNAEEIVRALAALEAPLEDDGRKTCTLCERVWWPPRGEEYDPANHEESCPWRQAREMYPDMPGDGA